MSKADLSYQAGTYLEMNGELSAQQMEAFAVKFSLEYEINNIRNKKIGVEQAANALRKSMNISQAQQFPLIKVLSILGIKAYQKELKPRELLSYIYISPRCTELYGVSTIMCVNILESYNDKRFALAYELGRYLYDYNGKDKEYYNEYKGKLNKEESDKITQQIYSFANVLLSDEL